MSVKRRNHGRSKHGRGHVKFVRCGNCGRACGKDKAVKRFTVRNIVDASSQRDIKEASAYETYTLPKLFIQQIYCIACAIHSRTVRVRSVEARKIRINPRRIAVPAGGNRA
jgi:small subunit ribosomal protein S26e